MVVPKVTGGSVNSLTDPLRSSRPTLGIPRIVNHRFPCASSASDEGWITSPAGRAGAGGGGGGGGGVSNTHPAARAPGRRRSAPRMSAVSHARASSEGRGGSELVTEVGAHQVLVFAADRPSFAQ